MKLLLLITLLFLTISTTDDCSANPFACKITRKTVIKKKSTQKKIIYKGYALINKKKFAFIEFSDTQYTVTKGQKLESLVVLKISPDSIRLSMNNKVHNIAIKKNQE